MFRAKKNTELLGLGLVGESADLTPPQPPQKSSNTKVSNMSVPGAVRVYRELLEKILLVK
jgi:hypothetical protein